MEGLQWNRKFPVCLFCVSSPAPGPKRSLNCMLYLSSLASPSPESEERYFLTIVQSSRFVIYRGVLARRHVLVCIQGGSGLVKQTSSVDL